MTPAIRLRANGASRIRRQNRCVSMHVSSKTLLSLLSVLHAAGGTVYTPAVGTTSVLLATTPKFPRVSARRQSAACTDDSVAYIKAPFASEVHP